MRKKKTNLREEGELFYTALSRAQQKVIVTAVTDAETEPSPSSTCWLREPPRAPRSPTAMRSPMKTSCTADSAGDGSTRPTHLLQTAAAQPCRRPHSETLSWAQLECGRSPRPARQSKTRAVGVNQNISLFVRSAVHRLRHLSASRRPRSKPSPIALLRWFLTRNGGDRASSTAQNLGTIIHAAAETTPKDRPQRSATSSQAGILLSRIRCRVRSPNGNSMWR